MSSLGPRKPCSLGILVVPRYAVSEYASRVIIKFVTEYRMHGITFTRFPFVFAYFMFGDENAKNILGKKEKKKLIHVKGV